MCKISVFGLLALSILIVDGFALPEVHNIHITNLISNDEPNNKIKLIKGRISS